MPYAQPRIPTVVATGDEFLDTYQNGREHAAAYAKAMELSGNSSSIKGIADRIGKSEHTVRSWVKHGVRPHCVSGLERAVNAGLLTRRDSGKLTFQTDDAPFSDLNRLAASIFWTGTFAIDYPTVHCGIVDTKERLGLMKTIFEERLQGLEFGLTKHPQCNGYYLKLADGSAVYGRIMDVMGLPHADEPKCLPQYIKKIMSASR